MLGFLNVLPSCNSLCVVKRWCRMCKRRAGTSQEQKAESRMAGQPGASLMDTETLDAMCHFFLRHTAYAGRGWDVLDDSDSMVCSS